MDQRRESEPSEPTPGGSDWERPDESASAPDDVDTDGEVREDPETGSTKRDPAAEASGPPLVGDDPMGGAAPSG